MKKVLLWVMFACVAAGGAVASDPNELSSRFWVKFSDLPALVQPGSRFKVNADAEGRLTLTLFAAKTDMLGDLKIVSKDHVAAGEWHLLAFNYSIQQQRVAFYLDGRLQWENDKFSIPDLDPKGRLYVEKNVAEVREYTELPYAAEVEELSFASLDEVREFKSQADALVMRFDNTKAPSGLKKVAKERIGYFGYFEKETAKTPYGTFPTKRMKDTSAFLSKMLRVAESAPSSAIAEDFAVASFDALGQELVLSRDIPETADFSDTLQIFACPGEYEAAGLVVYAWAPLKGIEAKVSDLRLGNSVIPASSVDRKLVKRWYRSGGAWLHYFNDRRGRYLVPDLLVNDDSLVKVDENQRRNYLRMDYRDDSHYVDVGDWHLGHAGWDWWIKMNRPIPFADAKTLQPFDIEEEDRNQVLLFTFHVPEGQAPGLYTGEITFTSGDMRVKKSVELKVLPITLPREPSPYANLDDVYITHMNSFPDGGIRGFTTESRRASALEELKNIRAHNMFHTTGIWSTPEYAELARKAGFVPDKVFGGPEPYAGQIVGCWYKICWDQFFAGVPFGELTVADREAGKRAVRRAFQPWVDYRKKIGIDRSEEYIIFWSESAAYERIARDQAELGEVPRELGFKIFAHGFSPNQWISTDVQDMHSSISINGEEAKRWHAVGGAIINYCDPFPSSECPLFMRRKPGFWMYKTGFDGQMMHGFLTSSAYVEWAEDWGGDGSYRNFAMGYTTGDGAIYKLAWEGIREAYDDLRYLTRLKQLADANKAATDIFLRREAKRALAWLERLDPRLTDLDMIKSGVVTRILILQEAIAKHGGTMPDPDANVRKYGL